VQRIWAGRNRVYSAVKPVDAVGYFIHTPVQLLNEMKSVENNITRTLVGKEEKDFAM